MLERLESENRTFAKIGYPTRTEKSMVDKTALREAVINAIVHNDYSLTVPLVEIFSDRITVTSAGGLVNGLSQKDFFNCRSMPRNRILMRVFRDVELVESLGSGMTRILSAYDRSIFELTPSFVVATFPFESEMDEPISDEVKGGMKGGQKGGQKTDTKTSMKTGEKIIEMMRKTPDISVKTISSTLGLTRTPITKQIQKLKAQGRICRVGADKGGHWEVL